MRIIKPLLIFIIFLCFQEVVASVISFPEDIQLQGTDVSFVIAADFDDKNVDNHKLILRNVPSMSCMHSMQSESCCDMQCKNCTGSFLFVEVNHLVVSKRASTLFSYDYLSSFPLQRVTVLFRPPIAA